MLISDEKLEIKNTIMSLDQRTDEMHMAFQKYSKGDSRRMPEWEKLERDLVSFSRKKFFDFELSQQLDRVLHKFQNRKRIWLRWVDEFHRGSQK